MDAVDAFVNRSINSMEAAGDDAQEKAGEMFDSLQKFGTLTAQRLSNAADSMEAAANSKSDELKEITFGMLLSYLGYIVIGTAAVIGLVALLLALYCVWKRRTQRK